MPVETEVQLQPIRKLAARTEGVISTTRRSPKPRKDLVRLVRESGWSLTGPVWTGTKNLVPTRIRCHRH